MQLENRTKKGDKKMKKLLALCLTVVLILAMMPIIGASAAGKATFSVGSVTGAPGEEVTVAVSIGNNPGLTFAQIMVGYDANALEVVNIEKLTFAGKLTSCSPATANPIKVTYDNCLEDVYDNGDLANITFKIKETAADGDYALTVSADSENVFNVNFEDVPFVTVNGAITVESAVEEEPPVEINGLTFIAGKATGAVGDTVTVPVSIAGNIGLTFAQIKVAYDADALKVVNIEKLTFAGKQTSCSPITANPIKVTYDNCLEDIYDNGDLAIITFEIKDGAADGDYALTVTADSENVFNVAFEDVPFSTINGVITVGAGSGSDECDHEWAWNVADEYLATEATCTDAATYYESCEKCGAKGTETFEAGKVAAHKYVEIVDAKYLATEATCEDVATYYVSCETCGAKGTDTFAAGKVAAHNYVEVADDKYLATAATCTAKATYYVSCSACGVAGTDTFAAGVVLEHTATQVVDDKYLATEATCENAATYYVSCSACGAKLDATFASGEALAHNYVEVADAKYLATAADCTNAATYYVSCSACGEAGTDTFASGDALGHSYGEWIVTKEPTETETGLKEKECSVCGDKVTAEIPMISVEECEHVWAEVVDDEYLATAADCTNAATYYVSCSACGEAGTDTFAAGDALGHSYGEWIVTKEPTTTETGVQEKECSVCGDKVTEEIPMLPVEECEHVWAQVVADEYLATAADCTNAATYYVSCSACGEVGDATFAAGEALGHSYGEWITTKEPTETETGLKEKECSACGDKVTEEIEKLPVVIVEKVELTVGEVLGAPGDEVTVDVSVSNNPGFTYAQIFVGYDAEALEVVEITPVEFAGNFAIASPITSNPVSFSWNDGLNDVTDTGVIAKITFKIKDAKAGDYAITASVAEAFDIEFNDVPAAGAEGTVKVCIHSWVEVADAKYIATAATCTAKATYYKHCELCGTVSDATFAAGEVLEHTAAQVVADKYLATEATCTEAATYYVSCSVCGAKLDATFASGAALGHNYVEVVDAKYLATEATCTEAATYYVSCSACDAKGTDTFASGEALGHAYVEVVADEYLATEATCTEAATYYVSCSACGEAGEDTFEAGEALGHDYAEVADEKYLATEATCEAKATYYVSCSVCGEAGEDTFEAGELAAHVLNKNDAVDATCDAEGSIENWTCEVCEKIFADAEADKEITADDLVVEKIAHKYGEWKVVKEATTTEKGSQEKVCEHCGDKVVEETPVLPEKPAGDKNETSPATSDINVFVVASMIIALAAAAVVVLKKKA